MNTELVGEKIKYFYLKRHSLFINLNEDVLHYYCARVRMKKLRRNQVITFDGDMNSRLYFIGDGTLKLVGSDRSGNSFLKDILVEGDIFGDLTLSGQTPDEYAVVLKNNTVVFYFPVQEFRDLLRSNHGLAINYADTISNRLSRISERHQVWNKGDAKERLRYFFGGWAACAGRRTHNKIILQNYFSLNDISDFICVTRQFMHIMLKELKSEGLLLYGKKEIEISESFFTDRLLDHRQAV